MYKTNEDYNLLMMSVLSTYPQVRSRIIWVHTAEITLRTLDKTQSAAHLRSSGSACSNPDYIEEQNATQNLSLKSDEKLKASASWKS
ncbi:hypothetical protein CEXT_416171 [Caerostris extrusa]|uniref:Uncharacterized protein n=1 Tax=Caerostris extrusa TaxID=172846 RepID=A0AAV4P5U6_CAEEX|nr:hypothetical protein CEXT_416171 [Caerostris extrusa]